MIHVKLIGGLGNQLFQIAFAYDLSKKLEMEVFVDTSQYENYKIRDFDLDKFEISKHVYFHRNENKKFDFLSKIYRVYQKIFKSMTKSDSFGKFIYEHGAKFGLLFNFDPYYYPISIDDNINLSDNLYLYGYFQSECYFKDSKDDIKKLLQVNSFLDDNEEEYSRLIESNECIALSMRLGEDYFNCDVLNVCDESYYLEAINKITKLVGDLNIFVFSDDIDLAKKLLKKYDSELSNIFFIENTNATQSLRLMYSCDHFIIPNSSFSWWGAYLSKNSEKIIISPERWYNYKNNIDDIYFKSMRRIDEL